MNTFAIHFTDFTGRVWYAEWVPYTSKNEKLSDSDIQDVVYFIKNGKWLETASDNAKDCYNVLASKIVDIIITDAMSSNERTKAVCEAITNAYYEKQFSPDGEYLMNKLERIVWDSEDTSEEGAEIIKKIMKTEKLFAVKFAGDPHWLENIEIRDLVTCCICGIPMTHGEGHNPYPVRAEAKYGEKKPRCCKYCDEHIVNPCRILFGRTEEAYNRLNKMGFEQLSIFEDFANCIIDDFINGIS